MLWQHIVDSWIYNDQEGNIIFEVTPHYPGIWLKAQKKLYKTYEEWVKTYKSILKKIIPHEVAKKWLIDTQKVLDIIEKNTQKYCDTHCDESSHYYRKEE